MSHNLPLNGDKSKQIELRENFKVFESFKVAYGVLRRCRVEQKPGLGTSVVYVGEY